MKIYKGKTTADLILTNWDTLQKETVFAGTLVTAVPTDSGRLSINVPAGWSKSRNEPLADITHEGYAEPEQVELGELLGTFNEG